jgi:hypothetical protein
VTAVRDPVTLTTSDGRRTTRYNGERLPADAAMDLYRRPGQATAVGLKQLCPPLDREHLRRVLEAVGLLRPDAAPPRGWSR